ncbi:hypothetical protein CR513_58912, partial [Mucuna pruriens]
MYVGGNGNPRPRPLIIRYNSTSQARVSFIVQVLARHAYSNNAVPWRYPTQGTMAPPVVGKDATLVITNIAKTRGVTRSERVFTLDGLRNKSPPVRKDKVVETPKKVVIEEEAQEFLKMIRHNKYEMGIINNITASSHLSFSEVELPNEGKSHNQPLHITVKCGNYMIARVLIDNGSSLNVMPKATLDKLYLLGAMLKSSPIVVRAFEGSQRE